MFPPLQGAGTHKRMLNLGTQNEIGNLIKERNDKESRKVYGTISSIGGVIFVVMLTLTILALV